MSDEKRVSVLTRYEALTEDEWRTIDSMRAAQEIIGGDPLVPVDMVGMANEVVRLRDQLAGAVDALDEAIKAARLFNRSGMTWLEYDRLLVRLEGVVNQARGQ